MTTVNNEHLQEFVDKKEEFFDTLFEKQVTKHQQSRDGQFVSVKIVCNNTALDYLFNKLYKDYKVKESYLDFKSECIFWSYIAIMRFQIKDEGVWDSVIAGNDKANMGRLITNIKTTVKHEIYRYVNEGAKFTRGKVGDKTNQHVMLKFDIKSLDALISLDGEEGTIVDLISEESNFFHSPDIAEYQVSHFAKWLKENKDRVLAPSQVIFLAQLEKTRKVEGYTNNDVEAVMGMKVDAVNSRIRRIKNRIAKKWLLENQDGAKNRLQITVESELELWQPLLDILDSDDLINQNQKLSEWILGNIENQKVANMLYDPLTEAESIMATKSIKAFKKDDPRAKLPSTILYVFTAGVMNRIEELKNTKTTVTLVTKAPNYALRMYDMQKKEWNNAPVKVTDLEGNFLREEQQKTPKRKSNIQLVLPSGALIILGE